MRCLVLLAVAVAAAVAVKDEMLETNRIPTGESSLEALGDTCGECKSVVHAIVEAVDDPQKLAELKLILGALCHETSYAEECKLFVSKIDIFIKRLEPYLRDAEAVCKKMRLCANPRLSFFHRAGLLYVQKGVAKMNGDMKLNDFVCDECQLAAVEFKKALDDEKQRKEIKTFISESICKKLRKYSGTCDLMVEQFLPELFQELDNLLANPKQACAALGFCSASLSAKAKANKQLTTPKRTLKGFWRRSQHLNTKHGQILMSCFECKVAVDTVIFQLKTNDSTYDLANDLQNGVCPKLPEHLQDGCNDFLHRYAPTVVSMTVQQADSETLCAAFKMCDAPSLAALAKLSAAEMEGMQCDACRAFSAFMEYEVSQPDFKADLVSGVRSHVCSKTRSFDALCENLAESYVPRVVDKMLTLFAPQGNFCTKMVHAC